MDDPRQAMERARAVAAYYDRLAPVYGEGEYFRARRAAVVGAIAAEIGDARAVLDLGCGNGAYAAELAAMAAGALVAGADLSPAMLHAARRRVGARLSLVQADATALPFQPGSFDLVFMSHVLLLVADLGRCVTEVAGSLAPGGRLIATIGTGSWRDTMRPFLDADEWRDLAALFASTRLQPAANDETRAAAACAQVGLRAEWREAPFSVTWAAVEEWVHIRWLTIADETLRTRVERWLAQVRPRTAGLMLPVTETLLVAHKPAAGVGA